MKPVRAAVLSALAALVLGGSPLAAQEVTVSTPGASEELRSVIRDASLVRTMRREGETNPQDLVAAAQADYRRVLAALYSEGFYGGTVSILINGREAAQIPPLAPPPAISSIRILVEAGPPFTFGRAEIAPTAPGTELPEGFASGAPARSAVIGQAASAGISGWRDVGHAKADIAAQQVTARHPQQRLDVGIALAPGPRLTFGRLTVKGNQDVRTERVSEIAGLPSGEVFSPAELEDAVTRLRRTGAFQSVAVTEGDRIAPDGSLPITITVIEQKPRRFGFGAELSSLDGVTLSAFWMHRNLLGGAERLRVEGEISGIGGTTGGTDYRFSTRFGKPAVFSKNTDFYALAEVERLDEPDFFTDRASIEAGFTRRLSDRLTVEAGLGLRTAEVEDALGQRAYTIVTLPLSATFDTRDAPLDATQGYYLDLDVTPFVGLDGTGAGGRIKGDARYYRALGETERVVLAFRGQLGSVLGVEAQDAPPDFLFYSGGGGTVRGHDYQSLAVELPGGDRIGGRSFVGGSAEARVGVTETIGLVGFYDIGYVGPEPLPDDQGDWHAGAGIGLRYDTGFGPIRLDVATPVSGDDKGGSIQFYVGIGQAF